MGGGDDSRVRLTHHCLTSSSSLVLEVENPRGGSLRPGGWPGMPGSQVGTLWELLRREPTHWCLRFWHFSIKSM